MGNSESSLQSGEVSCVLDELRSLEQKLSSIHAVQKQQVDAFAQHIAATSTANSALKDKYSDIDKEHKGQSKFTKTNVDESLNFLYGSHVNFGRAKVIVGPVVGKVTENRANVLLEVDSSSEITCHVCLVSEECPNGREVFSETKQLLRRRPAVFQLTGLSTGTKYCIVFSGLNKKDTKERVARFRTLKTGTAVRAVTVSDHSPGNEDFSEQNPWSPIAHRVFSDRVDVLIHLGGQVDCRNTLAQCAMMINHHQIAGISGSEQEQRLEELVCEKFRDAYRTTWTIEPLRSILSNTSNLMIWGNLEIELFNKKHEYAIPLQQEIPLYPAWLLKIARKVHQEYQRSLWEMRGCEEGQLRTVLNLQLDDEYSFHRLNGDFGVLLLDTRGSQIRIDGEPQQWPDSPILSEKQHSFIETTLKQNNNLSTLVVASDRPIVSYPPKMAKQLANSKLEKDTTISRVIQEQWCYNADDQEKLINALFSWDCKANVLLVCGFGGLNPFSLGLESKIFSQDFENRRMIRQLVTSPISFTADKNVESDLDMQGRLFQKYTYRHFEKVLSDQCSKSFAVFDAIPHLEMPRGDPKPAELLCELADYITDGHGIPNILLGPIVGKVTHDEAIILLEIDCNAYVCCELHEEIMDEKEPSPIKKICRLFLGRRPSCFHFSNLKAESKYKIRLRLDYDNNQQDVTPLTQQSMKMEFSGEFSTFPLPDHALNGIPHKVNISVVCNDLPHKTREKDSAKIWSKVRRLRDSCSLVLHVGGQVDLEIVGYELRTIILSEAKNATPNTLSKTKLTEICNKLEEVVRNAYRVIWSLANKSHVLRNGGNVMLVGSRDVKPPKCFFEKQHLLPWVNLVQSAAYKVACEYQVQLLTGDINSDFTSINLNDTKAIDLLIDEEEDSGKAHILSQYEKSIYPFQVFGPCGVIFIDLLTSRLRTNKFDEDADVLLGSFEWKVLEETLYNNCKQLQCLLIVSEYPIIDDSPLDARTKVESGCKIQNGNDLRCKWPYHQDETEHLLDLLFAWKSDLPGRDIMVVSGNIGVGMESVLLFEEAKTMIKQMAVGPIAAEPLPAFPYESIGNIDTFDSEPVEDSELECKYRYNHYSSAADKRMFGQIQISVIKDPGCQIKMWLSCNKAKDIQFDDFALTRSVKSNIDVVQSERPKLPVSSSPENEVKVSDSIEQKEVGEEKDDLENIHNSGTSQTNLIPPSKASDSTESKTPEAPSKDDEISKPDTKPSDSGQEASSKDDGISKPDTKPSDFEQAKIKASDSVAKLAPESPAQSSKESAEEKMKKAKELLTKYEDVESNLPAWLMAAFVGCEKAKLNRLKQEEQTKARETEMNKLRDAESKILEEHPTAKIISGDHTFIDPAEIDSESNAPNKNKGKLTKLDFRWMDFDSNYFGPETALQIKQLQKICKGEHYVEAVHTMYEKFAEPDKGISDEDVHKITLGFLRKKPIEKLKEITLLDKPIPQKLQKDISDFSILRRNYFTLKELIEDDNPVEEVPVIQLADCLILCKLFLLLVVLTNSIE